MIRFICIGVRNPDCDKVSLIRIGINVISFYSDEEIRMTNGDEYWLYGSRKGLANLLDDLIHGDCQTTMFLPSREFKYTKAR